MSDRSAYRAATRSVFIATAGQPRSRAAWERPPPALPAGLRATGLRLPRKKLGEERAWPPRGAPGSISIVPQPKTPCRGEEGRPHGAMRGGHHVAGSIPAAIVGRPRCRRGIHWFLQPRQTLPRKSGRDLEESGVWHTPARCVTTPNQRAETNCVGKRCRPRRLAPPATPRCIVTWKSGHAPQRPRAAALTQWPTAAGVRSYVCAGRCMYIRRRGRLSRWGKFGPSRALLFFSCQCGRGFRGGGNHRVTKLQWIWTRGRALEKGKTQRRRPERILSATDTNVRDHHWVFYVHPARQGQLRPSVGRQIDASLYTRPRILKRGSGLTGSSTHFISRGQALSGSCRAAAMAAKVGGHRAPVTGGWHARGGSRG